MKKNMGTLDRGLRVVLAAGAVGVSAALGFSTAGGIVALVVAAVMVLTAASGYCPLYSLLHVKTTGGSTGTSTQQVPHLPPTA
ncbi:MAG: DUF2892 domain-containing protein [Actinobacteria bacterium]|nr:DUF2892 domain-containing protein [Actinomycetota bacterium]